MERDKKAMILGPVVDPDITEVVVEVVAEVVVEVVAEVDAPDLLNYSCSVTNYIP
jgi:hypothetical protein